MSSRPCFTFTTVRLSVQARYPGEVYYLPPDHLPGGDPKNRRHLLLTLCDDPLGAATAAYCSTQGTEEAEGAQCVLVDPYATSRRLTGFDEPTYVYPSRLVPLSGDYLDELTSIGKVIDELPAVRVALAAALGIGTGSCVGRGSAAGSLRGRLLEVVREVREEIDTRYVVVVSDPVYSNRLRYLNAIPVYDIADHEPAAGDVEVTEADWLERTGIKGAIIATGCITNLYYREQVSRPIQCALDDAAMAELDSALRSHFVL